MAAGLSLLLVGCSPLGAGTCDPSAKVPLLEVPVPPVAGRTASFDDMVVDQAASRLYASDRTDAGVDVFDLSGDRPVYLDTVPTGAAPNGLALASDLGRLFVGTGAGVVAIDLQRLAVTARIATPGKGGVDLLDYDPRDQRVFAASPAEGLLVPIDARAGQAGAPIGLAPGLEQPRYSAVDGMVYVNGGQANELSQVDAASGRVVARRTLPVPCSPNGLAINPARDQALLGCSDRSARQMLLWNFKTGRADHVIYKAGAGDLVAYDARADRYLFAAEHWPSGPEIAVFAGDGTYVTAVGLPAASGSVAFDEAHSMVYTADQRPGRGGLFRFRLPGC